MIPVAIVALTVGTALATWAYIALALNASRSGRRRSTIKEIQS
jgi:hypothetical protein